MLHERTAPLADHDAVAVRDKSDTLVIYAARLNGLQRAALRRYLLDALADEPGQAATIAVPAGATDTVLMRAGAAPLGAVEVVLFTVAATLVAVAFVATVFVLLVDVQLGDNDEDTPPPGPLTAEGSQAAEPDGAAEMTASALAEDLVDTPPAEPDGSSRAQEHPGGLSSEPPADVSPAPPVTEPERPAAEACSAPPVVSEPSPPSAPAEPGMGSGDIPPAGEDGSSGPPVPDVDVPDVDVPDVEVPDVELPDVDLPDLALPDVRDGGREDSGDAEPDPSSDEPEDSEDEPEDSEDEETAESEPDGDSESAR